MCVLKSEGQAVRAGRQGRPGTSACACRAAPSLTLQGNRGMGSALQLELLIVAAACISSFSQPGTLVLDCCTLSQPWASWLTHPPWRSAAADAPHTTATMPR